jgi:DNA-binding transcriptional ArsR family regulator
LSQQLDDVFGALADPTRRTILEMLRDTHERSAGELAASFPGISRVAVSKHLGVLLRAGLVDVRKDGRRLLYSLNDRPLAEAYSV